MATERLERRRQRAVGEWIELKAAVRSETGWRLERLAWPVLIAGFVMGLEAARRLTRRAGGSTQA